MKTWGISFENLILSGDFFQYGGILPHTRLLPLQSTPPMTSGRGCTLWLDQNFTNSTVPTLLALSYSIIFTFFDIYSRKLEFQFATIRAFTADSYSSKDLANGLGSSVGCWHNPSQQLNFSQRIAGRLDFPKLLKVFVTLPSLISRCKKYRKHRFVFQNSPLKSLSHSILSPRRIHHCLLFNGKLFTNLLTLGMRIVSIIWLEYCMAEFIQVFLHEHIYSGLSRATVQK